MDCIYFSTTPDAEWQNQHPRHPLIVLIQKSSQEIGIIRRIDDLPEGATRA
jgi:hypothetical protein